MKFSEAKDIRIEYEATVVVKWPERGAEEDVHERMQGLLSVGFPGADVLAVDRPFMTHDRRAGFEKLYAILRKDASADGAFLTKELVEGWADEAGVGSCSAPDSYFFDMITGLGRFDPIVVGFKMENTEQWQVVFVRTLYNGLEGGWSWAMYL